MKTLLLPMLLLASVAGEVPVQVSRQNDTLKVSVSEPPSGWHYTNAELVVDGEIVELLQVSPTSWETSLPSSDSGDYVLYLCSDDSCRLIEGSWSVAQPLASVLAVAFGCGLLMNFMPCVLPVIGLKLAAFQGGKRWHYVAGVMASFMVLATLSMALGTGLSQLGFSHYRVALSIICVLMACHLLGMWQVPSLGVGGNWGPFGMGCLTVALGSSCAVPFIAPVMAYSLSASPLEVYLLFGTLGVGFCSPFLLPIRGIPGKLRHYVPVFERACGLGLLAVGGWLFSTLPERVLGPALLTTGSLLILLIFLRKFWPQVKLGKFWPLVMCLWLAGSLCLGMAGLYVASTSPLPDGADREVVQWPTDGPRIIFVTADWCMNCHMVYHTLKDSRVQEIIDEYDIPLVILDYTDRDPTIGKFLAQVKDGFRDVPVLLVEGVDGSVTVLTGLWTTGQVIQALHAAP